MMYNHFYSFYPSNSLHEVLYEQMERQSLLQGACSIFFLLNHIFYSRKKIQRKIHDQPWYKYWSISVFPVLEHCRMYTFQKCFFLKEKCWISSVDHVKKKNKTVSPCRLAVRWVFFKSGSKQYFREYFSSYGLCQSILHVLVPQAVDQGVQHGDHQRIHIHTNDWKVLRWGL